MRRLRSPKSPLLRQAAMATMAAAVVMPLVRRRLRPPLPVALAPGVAAPFALAAVKRRSKGRDAGLFFFHMWLWFIAHELPYDDPERLRRRLRIDYPIQIDTALGLGVPPNVRLQELLSDPDRVTALDRTAAWVHWLWFAEPHLALTWILLRHEERFPGAAARMAAVFNLGSVGYFAVPTAPPWWASQEAGRMDGKVRRIMAEVGQRFWRRAWPGLYGFLGGNPWAAMPSLHFAASVQAAIVLAEAGPVEGAIGWSYAAALGFSLVYLGEHYLVDLLAGLAVVEAVRRGAPLAAPALRWLSPRLQRLENLAAA